MPQTIEVPGLGQVQFPDGMSDADIGAAIRKTLGAKQEQPQADFADKIAANPLTRFAIGAAKPIIGAAQLGINAFSKDAGQAVNEHLQHLEEMTQRGAKTKAGMGTLGEVADVAGQIFSPVNVGLAKLAPVATSFLGRAAVGTGMGAAGGAMAPVTEGKDYWSEKGAQTGIGAATGGIATPILGKVVDVLAPKVSTLIDRLNPARATITNARASLETDSIIREALNEVGARQQDMTKQEIDALRKQVLDSLKSGKKLDAAALLRSKDFKELGMDYTQGQITRDPTQFALEKNLSTAPGVGVPLTQRFNAQNQRVQEIIRALRGDPAEPYQAGKTIRDTLAGVDAGIKKKVNVEYNAARDHLGRAAPMDAAGFSQKANLALDDGMLGAYLPAETRDMLNKVSKGEIPFNVNTAVQMDSVLSAAQRAAGKGTPQALAIGKVRDALNSANIADNVGEAAKAQFAKASGMARDRFKLHEAIPALEAAAAGEAPDTFVRDFVINGKVEDVQRLAKMLKSTNTDAFEEARSQLGDRIIKAAFGENRAGDKLAVPERLSRELRKIGTDKLNAFYTQEEIGQLNRLARVTAYMNSEPAGAPVNNSKNIGQLMTMAARATGMPVIAAAGAAAKNAVGNQLAASQALKTNIPTTANPLTESQRKALAKALMIGVSGSAGALAGAQ